MSERKTLSLKLSLSILFGVLVTICLTTGIVLAAFSTSLSINSGNVPVAKLNAQVWKSDKATQITSSNLDAYAGDLYISATKTDGTAVKVPSVMRVSATFAVSNVDSTKWVLQSNGWYYYIGIVGNGYEGASKTNAIKFGTKTATSDGHIMVDLMQFSTSTTGGFIKEWSPLAGKNASSTSEMILSDSKTIDGNNLRPNGSSSAIGYFSLFAGNTVLDPLDNTSSPTTSNSFMTNEITPTGSGSDYSYSGTQSIPRLSTGNMRIYNNASIPMVFTVNFTPQSIGGSGVSNLSVTLNKQANWFGDTTITNSSDWLYTKAVMPGQYIDIITPSISVSFNATKNTAVQVRLITTISVVDVDSFVNGLKTGGAYKDYVGKFNSTEATFYTWIQKMNSYWTTNSMTTKLGAFPEAGYAQVKN